MRVVQVSGIDPAVDGLLQRINTPAAPAASRWAALRRALDGQREFELAIAAGSAGGSAGDLYLRARAETLAMVLGMMDEIEHIIEEPA